ncbi:hypothetical protein KI387_015298, partial [Taxus chinensis]
MGCLGRKHAKDAVRANRPKLDHFAFFDLGQKALKYADSGVSTENGKSRTKVLGTLGTKSSDGPENGTVSGISADRGTGCTFVLGT